MLSKEVNELLTRVGKGTPCGELLRRYWHPICFSSEIINPRTTKPIRILGENLVLIRMDDGSLRLIQERCPHRGASLLYSFVEGDNIRCAYHGWLFNINGQCIEKPFESERVNKRCENFLNVYSAYEFSGLIFAYLGPEEHKPFFPKWDILVREDGTCHFEVQDDLQCNWLQLQENAVDVTHTYFLHSKYFEKLGLKDSSGFGEPLKRFGFQPFPWGILKSWSYMDKGVGWGNPLIFPNMLRILTEMHWRVPIDDYTTRIIWASFTPGPSFNKNAYPEIKIQPKRNALDGRYLMDTFMSQDAMAVETAGKIFDRTKENLVASDKGIWMYRKMLQEQINIVKNNGKPIANLYDQSALVDLREWMGGYLPMSCSLDPSFTSTKQFHEIFDEQHQECEIPDTSSILKGKVLTQTLA